MQRIRTAARSAAEHTVDSLGLAALASTSVTQRDVLLGAQFELNRKLAIFALTFNEALDTDIGRQVGTLVPQARPGVTPEALVSTWDKLTLVDDHEVEMHISADRFALEIAHACEWEIRELDAYIASLLGLEGADHGRNPLRAEIIARAMMRAVDAMSERADVRKVLGTEIGRSLSQSLRQTYADVVSDFRLLGLKPAGLTVRGNAGRPSAHGPLSGFDDPAPDSRPGALHQHADAAAPAQMHAHGGHVNPRFAHVGAPMTSLIRRLSHGVYVGRSANAGHPGNSGHLGHPGHPAHGSYSQHAAPGHWNAAPDMLDTLPADVSIEGDHVEAMWSAMPAGYAGTTADGMRLAAPNLIMAYREELHQAAGGGLDPMVIDVIAGLFDQILSDTKVLPQVARQIARLQLPVLRAALGDHSFFASRRHPVRRFINRIASLGAALDGLDSAGSRALLQRIAELVQEIVDGDFEQVAIYEQKLEQLEDFVAEQAREQLHTGSGDAADELLARKERELQAQAQFGQQMEGALLTLPVPDFLRDFLAHKWARVIAATEQRQGANSPSALRMRAVARELVMSVQPKGSPSARQQFLRSLPLLMKDLNIGIDRLGCSDEDRRNLFAKLLPAHAEALKVPALSTLQHNLLARQVDGALAVPLPTAAELPQATADTVQALIDQPGSVSFSPAEAQAVGLVDEASIDWDARPGIDLNLDNPLTEPQLTATDIQVDGLPQAEEPEPTSGRSLADHVQIGFAYQMQIDGEWRKVRLTHVSQGRGFYVFKHGQQQRQTVSLTHRMLVRLCETGRLRAYESGYLIERATARARRQLAALSAAPGVRNGTASAIGSGARGLHPTAVRSMSSVAARTAPLSGRPLPRH